MADPINEGGDGLEPLVPFAHSGGTFELSDPQTTRRYLQHHARDSFLMSALRAAIDGPPSLQALARLNNQQLLDRAAMRFLQGDLGLYAGRRLGLPTIFGVPGAFVEMEEEEAAGQAIPPAILETAKATDWIEIELVDQDGKPWPEQKYEIELADGSTRKGSLNRQGLLRLNDIPPGTCKVVFPELEVSEEGAEEPAPSGAVASTEIEIELVDQDGQPVPDRKFEIELADGSTRKGSFDQQGFARLENIPAGMCKLVLLVGASAEGGTAQGTEPSAAVAEEAPEPEAAAAAGSGTAAEAGEEASKAAGPHFFELALPEIPALEDEEESHEYPPTGAKLTLSSSQGYESTLAVSEGKRSGDGYCSFRFYDIDEQYWDDEFTAKLEWDGGEELLFEGAHVGELIRAAREKSACSPVFAPGRPAPQAEPEGEAGEEAGGAEDYDEAPNGYALPLRYLTEIFKG